MEDKNKLNKAHQILDDVISLVQSGRKGEALSLIRETLEVKKTQSYEWLERILSQADVHAADEPTNTKDLEFRGKYVFNKEDDKYIFFLKKFGKNIVLENSLVKSLVLDYSNFDKNPQTLSYLAKKYDIPKKILQEILQILEFTHDDVPVLDEELDRDPEEIVSELLTSKKFSIYQTFQKKDWEDTQEKAKKWEQFIQGQLHPLKDLIHTWEPPEIEPLDHITNIGNQDEMVLIGISDLHFGLFADEADLFFSENSWTIDDTVRVVGEYADKIVDKLGRRSLKLPKKAVICLMGDLIHSITGKTDKGTNIEAHPLNQRQLDYAYESLFAFIQIMSSLFEEIDVKAVNGNHSYFGDYTLGKMLEVAFRQDDSISFDLSCSRFLSFKVFNNGFVMDHGATSHSKSKLPAQKGPRGNYAQSVFLSKKELAICDHRYYIVADQHHLEHQEYNNFELIMLSTPSGGDRYSDSSVLLSRPRQSCMIFTEEGLSEVLHFYFD